MLALARDLIALRKQTPDLNIGAYTPLPAPDCAWVWKRAIATRSPSTSPMQTSRSTRWPDACSSAPTAPVTAQPSRATLQLRAWEGCIVAID